MPRALPRTAAIATALALLAPAAASAQCAPEHAWGLSDASQAAEVVRLVNEHRQSMNPPLEPLAVSRSLTRSAIWKSRHMRQYSYFEHDDPAPPVARDPHRRMRDCGYPDDQTGENIAFNFFTPEAVMAAWLSSPGHRANIENSSYRSIGVGESGLRWTQNFGRDLDQPNAAPTAVADSPAATEDVSAPVVLDVLVNDIDEDLDWAYIRAMQQPANGTVELTADRRALTYVPKANFSGSDTFTYTLIDIGGQLSTATATVRVANVNDRPRAVAETVRLPRRTEKAVIRAAANDTDIDGDRLRVAKILTRPKRGSAKVKRGRIQYTPRRGRVRPDQLVYRVTDGKGGTAKARVRIRPKR
jgi:uncharacterized protein YkwD